MSEVVNFILHRFYISFCAGSIINIYLLLLIRFFKIGNFFPDTINKLIKIPDSFHIAVFIFFAHIFGILIEAYTEGFLQHYFMDKKPNKPYRKGIIYFFFYMPTTVYAYIKYCKRYKKRKIHKKNLMADLIHGFEDRVGENHYNISNISSILRTIAIEVSRKLGNKYDVYRWKDLSFSLQLLRSAFLLLPLFSILGILFFLAIDLITKNGMFYIRNLWVFFLISFILSLVVALLLLPLTLALSKRYIHELASYYNVL